MTTEEGTPKATVGSLTVENLEGAYTPYENVEGWVPVLAHRNITPWIVGQQIFANHRSGNFRTEAKEDSAVAGSRVHLRISGITPLAALAILGGRMNNGPPETFGRIVVPFEDSLDVLTRIPEDAEGGTYAFFAQQWEVGVDREGRPAGLPAYPAGSLIYVSKISTLEVRPRVDEEAFWKSFEPWSEEDAEEVRENIRRMRRNLF